MDARRRARRERDRAGEPVKPLFVLANIVLAVAGVGIAYLWWLLSTHGLPV